MARDEEKKRAYMREYNKAHRVSQAKAARERYWNNREERLAYARKYSATHKAKHAVYMREYRKRNKEALNAHTQNRRARMQRIGGRVTRAQWQAILQAYSHRCAYCGVYMKHLTQDHVIPLSRGGQHLPDNIVPACKPCNLSKHANPAPTLPSLRFLL